MCVCVGETRSNQVCRTIYIYIYIYVSISMLCIIRSSQGSSDNCHMEHEEELFEYCILHDLLTLGWIHVRKTIHAHSRSHFCKPLDRTSHGITSIYIIYLYLSINQSINLSIYQSLYLSIYLSLYLSLYLSIVLSIVLSMIFISRQIVRYIFVKTWTITHHVTKMHHFNV